MFHVMHALFLIHCLPAAFACALIRVVNAARSCGFVDSIDISISLPYFTVNDRCSHTWQNAKELILHADHTSGSPGSLRAGGGVYGGLGRC